MDGHERTRPDRISYKISYSSVHIGWLGLSIHSIPGGLVKLGPFTPTRQDPGPAPHRQYVASQPRRRARSESAIGHEYPGTCVMVPYVSPSRHIPGRRTSGDSSSVALTDDSPKGEQRSWWWSHSNSGADPMAG